MSKLDQRDSRSSGLISGIIGGTSFGTAAIFIRLITINALSITVWRLIFGGLFLIIIYRIPRKIFKQYISLSIYLSFILFLHFFFFIKSVQNTYIINATLITNSAPLITLITLWLLRLERVTLYDCIIVLLGFAGILVMSIQGFKIGQKLIGDIEALIAATMLSFYAIFARTKMKNEINPSYLAGFIYTLAGLQGLIVAEIMLMIQIPTTTNDIIFISLLTLIPTVVGHTLYLYSLRSLSPHETQVLALLEPIIATILGFIFLGEVPPASSILGGVFICISILLVSFKSTNKD